MGREVWSGSGRLGGRAPPIEMASVGDNGYGVGEGGSQLHAYP